MQRTEESVGTSGDLGSKALARHACVYTTLIGGYEKLNEQPVATNSRLPFICLITGKVETLGKTLEPGGSVFYPAGEPHGMRNVGNERARYLVFEFHG